MGDKQYKTNNSYTDFFYHAFRNILIVGIPLVIISALVLSLPHSFAEISSSSSDNISFTLSTSCTIRGEVISVHTANLNGGQVVEDVGNTKLNAYCNDNNGYSIYAIGSSDDIDGNTDLISSINDNYNVHTGIYDSSTVSPSTPSSWAMKLTAGVGTNPNPTVPTIENNYNTYKEIPSTYTLVAKRTSKTDMDLDTTLSGSYINTTYQIYASSIQPAGTYTGKVKYVMVHPHSNAEHLSMQNVAIWGNAVLSNPGDSVQATDQRDGKKYWVTRLADGHIWMTQNLDLDLDPTKPLTSNDTDLTDHSLTGAYADGYSHDPNTGITTWTPERKTIDFQNTAVTGWANSNSDPHSASKTDSAETGHASLGNYYNWTAAIASNDSSSLTQDTISDTTKNPKNSICPKGWRLPTISNQSETVAGSTNEYARLNYLYNNNSTTTDANLIISPLWFVRGGYVTMAGALNDYNKEGTYWSNTSFNSDTAYYLSLKGSAVNPSYNYSNVKRYGFPVRCVAG